MCYYFIASSLLGVNQIQYWGCFMIIVNSLLKDGTSFIDDPQMKSRNSSWFFEIYYYMYEYFLAQ